MAIATTPVVKGTTTRKPNPAPKAEIRLSSDWIEVGDAPVGSLEVVEEFSVTQMKAEGYNLASQVKLNSNGNPFLLCIDTVEQKKSALYMFKALSANVTENQVLKADDISIFLVKNSDGEEGLVVGTKGATAGISFF